MPDLVVSLTPPPVITATVNPSEIAVSVAAAPALAVTIGPVAGAHNGLAGIQGGALNDYYHLPLAKYNVLGLHESLTDLLGGLALEHYHLNAAEYAARGLHNSLSDLQGGSALERYHLTAAQHAALGTGAHNDTTGKQGGAVGEFYHLSAADYAARILGSGTIGYIPYFTGAQGIGNSNIFYDAMNGRVGIGTITPDQALSIIMTKSGGVYFDLINPGTGNNSTTGFYLGESSGGGKYGGMNYLNSSYTLNGAYIPGSTLIYGSYDGGLSMMANHAAGVIRFFTGGYAAANERMRIEFSGMVGIGAAACVPGAATSHLSVFSNQNSSTSMFLKNEDTGGAAKSQIIVGNAKTGGHYGIFMHLGTGFTPNGLQIPNRTCFLGGDSEGLAFLTTSTYPTATLKFGTYHKERITIDYLGNIVVNDIGEDADFRIESDADEYAFVIDGATGNKGMGVASPTAVLHLKASAAAANLASMKIDAGVVATVPVSGNIESDGTHLYWTDSGGTRRQLDN